MAVTPAFSPASLIWYPLPGLLATFTGKITGPGALLVSGPGKILLYGANDYTGLTTVAGGILELKVNAQGPLLGSGAAGADITGGMVIFDYIYGSDPVATIKADILSGLIHTTAAGKYLAATDNGFNRVTVSLVDLIPGDADCNGTVNGD